MRLSTAAAIVAAISSSSSSVVVACPYYNAELGKTIPSGHPPLTDEAPRLPQWLQRRSLEAYPRDAAGNLEGSPSFDNGTVNLPGLLAVVDPATGATLADVVAAASAATSTDLCMVRIQQLPPPAGPDGTYAFDRSLTDLKSLQTLADTMTQRFYDLGGPAKADGGIFLAAGTNGAGGAKAMCAHGMDADRFCDPAVQNNPLTWPEAITGYKLTPATVEAVKAAIAEWRASPEGHLPSLSWVYNAGDADAGGSEYGVWGDPSVGLLASKIVPCDGIPDRLMYYEYPEDVATSDYVDPATGMTVAEEVYEWWTNACGYVDGQEACGPYVPPEEPACQPWCPECEPCKACAGLVETVEACAECAPCVPCEGCWEEDEEGPDDEPAEPEGCAPWCTECESCKSCIGSEAEECADCAPCMPCAVCFEEENDVPVDEPAEPVDEPDVPDDEPAEPVAEPKNSSAGLSSYPALIPTLAFLGLLAVVNSVIA